LHNRFDLLVRFALVLPLTYIFTIGGIGYGILDPANRPLTLALLIGSIALWWFMHWRQRWLWHRTALDPVFILWALSFTLSLLANTEDWRRISIGLWYVGLYILVWYMLHDAIANKALRSAILLDSFLIVGFIVTIFGYIQLSGWFGQLLSTGVWTMPVRPGGLFGNPNFMGAFLVVLIPLLLSRFALAAARPLRLILALDVLLSTLLLFLTFSRGAWLGLLGAALIWGFLFASSQRKRSLPSLLQVLRLRSRLSQFMIGLGILLTLVAVVLALIIFIRSFNDPGRAAGLRTEIWVAALQLFEEKPLLGQGLYTFGQGLVRLPGINPDRPHSHAHSVPLQIAAELGIVGLLVLLVTTFVIVRHMRINWRTYQGSERIAYAGSVAAVWAFAIHHLTDFPAMMPAIALTGLLALVLALVPPQPQPILLPTMRILRGLGVFTFSVALLASALWDTSIYSRYVNVLQFAARSLDYASAAQQLQPIIDSDPALSIYQMQQAFLYGMAASAGDQSIARTAVAAYDRFLQLESGYAVAWANRAGLHWQLGDHQQAIADMRRAVELDSANWHFPLNLARYYESLGDQSLADEAYLQALTLYPDASLYTEFVNFVQAHPRSLDYDRMQPLSKAVLALVSGDDAAARRWWEQTPLSTASHIVRLILALHEQDRDAALSSLKQAGERASQPNDQVWLHLGLAYIARFDEDLTLFEAERAVAYESLNRWPLTIDENLLLNIPHAQFMRLAIGRQFLPQVVYPTDDPALIYLLENFS